ncbi:MAG: lipid A biosynthesis acyltransferase [Burkholderiales bacterium]|nr:lipid A biosynthesis acyltransferase [Burkholderiales bacterium]
MTRAVLAILWVLHFLPRRVLSLFGHILGLLFFLLSKERRRVVTINLKLCFPSLSARERNTLRLKHFIALGRAIADSSIAWWSKASSIRSLATIKGKKYLNEALREGPVIVLAPHFVGLEVLGIRLSLEENAQSMYSNQKDPVLNQFLISRRTRFRNIQLISRQDGIKNVVRALKARLPLFFLPDMDLGARDAVFVPFFGVIAATVDAVPRLAALTNAKVIPVTIQQFKSNKPYEIEFFPAWDNYPSNDVTADTITMNKFIEEQVHKMPEQYYWVHKRFKTQPNDAEQVYD